MTIDSVPLSLHTPAEIQSRWATRLRASRLRMGWKQSTLAERADVSLPTIRRFERDGQTTVANLLKICGALGVLDELEAMFEPKSMQSLAMLERAVSPLPRRGRR